MNQNRIFIHNLACIGNPKASKPPGKRLSNILQSIKKRLGIDPSLFVRYSSRYGETT